MVGHVWRLTLHLERLHAVNVLRLKQGRPKYVLLEIDSLFLPTRVKLPYPCVRPKNHLLIFMSCGKTLTSDDEQLLWVKVRSDSVRGG